MRERDVELYLVRVTREMGGVAWKWVSPGQAGVPDRIVVLPGRVIFVELKAPGGAPTAQQRRVHTRLRTLGADVRVIDALAEVDEMVGRC